MFKLIIHSWGIQYECSLTIEALTKIHRLAWAFIYSFFKWTWEWLTIIQMLLLFVVKFFLITFYPIETRKFKIFDLKCDYKSGHLNIKQILSKIFLLLLYYTNFRPSLHVHASWHVRHQSYQRVTIEFRQYRAHTYLCRRATCIFATYLSKNECKHHYKCHFSDCFEDLVSSWKDRWDPKTAIWSNLSNVHQQTNILHL